MFTAMQQSVCTYGAMFVCFVLDTMLCVPAYGVCDYVFIQLRLWNDLLFFNYVSLPAYATLNI